jgi:sigma-B regulation protein RsbU (phosphoserine phosphatase)
VLPESPYDQATVHLDRGDLLLLYTDGVLDARNPHDEPFGRERMERCLLDNRSRGAVHVVQALADTVQAFSGGEAPFDDVTILAARRVDEGGDGS